MAVLVEFSVVGATEEKMVEVEERTQARGQALGRPPYDGLIFLAATPNGAGLRLVSAWRTERDFHAAHDSMLGPDLATVGLSASDVVVSPIASMAIPGNHLS